MYKIISACCLFLFSVMVLNAQEKTTQEQRFNWSNNRAADINLKFASNIKVSSWNKSELYIKTIITYEDKEHLKIHQMDVEELGNNLVITADYAKDFFKGKKYNCWGCDPADQKENQDCICFKLEFEIMMPKNAKVKLETISGNIELQDLDGPLNAKSISGFIDLGLKPSVSSNLSFKSVTGEIYTDFDVNLDKSSSAFSKKLNTALNGGGPVIALETVSGDIFFRKK